MSKLAIIRIVAAAACAGLAAWKGIKMDPEQLVEVLAFALGASQLVRRVGDSPAGK